LLQERLDSEKAKLERKLRRQATAETSCSQAEEEADHSQKVFRSTIMIPPHTQFVDLMKLCEYGAEMLQAF
jgi:hypothetical protein